ncbi:D-cysteine desulfhydrase family protein [Pseudoclavibacter soli]|uniref:D-cysteine desulfhydrase family protein n=1 Tax=Pseudoclavibacter soli TaxID=452623 RepID=UPI000416376D|nr:D-cysteine desulfhydrase family protein [Pseudoclavibacter soli]
MTTLLARYARRPRFVAAPTPLQRLDRLRDALGGAGQVPELWIKRDDLTGLAGGGNKARKLEFLLDDALAQGADTVVTIGAVQSNHARQTAAAANRVGLAAHLVLEVPEGATDEYLNNGNALLDDLLGAEITLVPEGDDSSAAADAVVARLRSAGRAPILIPVGGSSPLGSLGYVEAFTELVDSGLDLDAVVVASGSAGTQAGLVVGAQVHRASTRIIGVTVSRSVADQQPKVLSLVEQTLQLLDVDPGQAAARVELDDRFVGPGYGVPTDEMRRAVRLFAETEGILLDPVYTGKAAAGLLQLVREGAFAADQRVAFVHTGGTPGLYAYRSALV